ncbi:MAG: esterase [Flavobacteriales bacterium]|nr:esterase [Flavobacteriales bacterium]
MNIFHPRTSTFLVLFAFLSHYLIAQNPSVSRGKIYNWNNFTSKYVDARNISIWLPEGYDSTKSYPVLYLHDGQMLFDSTTTWNKQEWKIDEISTQLIEAKQISPFIVVGIWNNGEKRRFEYMPQKPFEKLTKESQSKIVKLFSNTTLDRNMEMQADNYLKFIVKELKPKIDKTFATKKDQANTFIAGSSFGGLISCYAICEYQSIFGGAICMSTHWPGMFPGSFIPELPEQFINYLKKKLPNPSNHRIYFDYGTETLDAYYEPYQLKVDQLMEQKGYKDAQWMSLKFVGEDHSKKAWSKRLNYPLIFIFGR